MTPQEHQARYFAGLDHLAEGRYAEGWPLYELRRTGAGAVLDPPAAFPNLTCPEWSGEDLAGKHVMVFGEQGFGDQIMFARFIPELQARGASVTYVCSSELARLFPTAQGENRRSDFRPAHYWCLVGSLPYRLAITLETLPAPYPLAMPGGADGIGVVTRGRPTHSNDANRSLPDALARPLLALGRDLSQEATGARDFLETARIIADLALVISVDTAIAHLAASMGKPVWLLLPATGTDWRWLRDRNDSPWYPSIRIFRQTERGDWSGVIGEVRRALDAG